MNLTEQRAAFLSRLGEMPETCPLDARTETTQQEAGYVRERVTFAVSPGVRIPAFLLIPDDLAAPAPAVLCIHQHNGEYHLGKSEPAGLEGNPDLAYALELCQRGYVTLAPDLEAFEERQATAAEREHWQTLAHYPPEGGMYERFVATRYLQQGSSLQARYVHDLARAVDYLQARPEVDGERIGAIGHSLGGQEVCWSLLHDRRLKAGVCSCGIGTFATIFRDGVNHNFAAYAPGLLTVGDADALIAAIAPTPLLMTAGSEDWIFPIDGVRQIGHAAREAYAGASAPDAFRLLDFEGGHGCPSPIRAECYAWLDRWLKS